MVQEINNRIVLWCGGAPNQRALANKIFSSCELAGIVIDERPGNPRIRSFSTLTGLIWDRLRFRKIYFAWKYMMRYYSKKYPDWPEVPILRVAGINNAEAANFTSNLGPAIIAVSGTGLVRNNMLKVPARIGIINLHTGLSPYVKGGPNCTNWCIANNEFHLVGNTIMWINAGIDAGNLITTETIDIRHEKTLSSAHIRVMEHAHDLYLRAIRYLINSKSDYYSVAQDSISKGSLFLNRMWDANKRKQLLRNWKYRRLSQLTTVPVTVPLPETGEL